MFTLRRLRGAVLRLVRRRALSITIGLALALPAGWVQWFGGYDEWWVEGLCLVIGATGIAIAWTGLTGPSPDWIDDEDRN
jgi:hypothetical protein